MQNTIFAPRVKQNFTNRQARIDAELNNMAWRVRPEEVLVEVGTGLGASPALHSINEVLKVLNYLQG